MHNIRGNSVTFRSIGKFVKSVNMRYMKCNNFLNVDNLRTFSQSLQKLLFQDNKQ